LTTNVRTARQKASADPMTGNAKSQTANKAVVAEASRHATAAMMLIRLLPD